MYTPELIGLLMTIHSSMKLEISQFLTTFHLSSKWSYMDAAATMMDTSGNLVHVFDAKYHTTPASTAMAVGKAVPSGL